MKKISLSLILPLLFSAVSAQKNYWQQEVNFTITVSLNDKDHSLDAFETIEYINHSPDTLKFLWFHLWPNAYKNDRTAFSEQMLKERRLDFYFSKPADKGYVNQLNFAADNHAAAFVTDSSLIDVVKVLLPKPLAPGSRTIITTPFKVKLPYNFSRGGHIGNNYQVAQWFPKPAIYDRNGWHPMPYLDQGEYYSDFGKYDVQITAPSAYEVAATGILQDAETLRQLKSTGRHIAEGKTKTWHFLQDSIHDFAWFASKEFVAHYDTVQLPSGKVVEVSAFYRAKSRGWDASLKYAKSGLRKYSEWLGEYPYTTATVVQGSRNLTSGGMEYPTITLITTQSTGAELDATIVHEIGHNWFEAALATNEREHPWMDEGMNTYYQKRYEDEKYKRNTQRKGLFKKTPDQEEDILFRTIAKIVKDQPIETTSEKFTTDNYGLVVYYKTSEWMRKLENDLGREAFDKVMHIYYSQWKYKHPAPEDFKTLFENNSSKNVESNFAQLHNTGFIYPSQKKTIKPTVLFNLRNTDKYNYISFAPALGYNSYDKTMFGISVHNYQLPINNFQFVGAVMYGTGSHKWNGLGEGAYNIYKKRSQVAISLGYTGYSINDFTTDGNAKLILRMQRWTPSVNVTLFDKDPQNTRRINLRWKAFLLTEDQLNFETVISGADTTGVVNTIAAKSYINRLSAGISDNRKLFPYSLSLTADQGKEFIRTGLTAKYYFNYPDGKTGMDVRFFAGKFFYLVQKTNLSRANNDRYLLNLSAPKGYEDYTYSDYFIGRNEFEGWKSQQIMERDGFFKVNTELLSDKVGKTDDWLMALNLSTGLPDNLNPLSVLPFKLPVKLFADIGTYAEAWKQNPASGRFVYDAGIQFSLFSSLVNVYVPVFYSSVYSNYYKSVITEKRFLKTISFNINLQRLQLKQFFKDVQL